jgi:putative transposase
MDQRREFCAKAGQGGNFRALCREYGISTKTGYKWKQRVLRYGTEGLAEESRRPHSHPESLGERELCEIIRLKNAHPMWGPRKIRELYLRQHGQAASESSFKRVLERSGLTQKRKRRKQSESGRLNSGRRAQKPNEVWTVDFKGWWWNGRQRCEPLSVRDEYSRFILELRAVEDASAKTVRRSFERLFECYGLPEAIRSDNGSPFASTRSVYGLSRLSAWWVALGIELERGRPGHPQDNGAHERLHRDISLQLESLGQGDQNALDLWREEFNHQRPHQALAMRLPAEVYVNSQRKYDGGIEEIDYGPLATRQVSNCGCVMWHKHLLFLSASLAGWSVGLKPDPNHRLEVWFANILLGWIDPELAVFLRADIRPQPSKKCGLKAAELQLGALPQNPGSGGTVNIPKSTPI